MATLARRQLVEITENDISTAEASKRKLANYKRMSKNDIGIEQLGENLVGATQMVYPDLSIT